MDDFQQQLIVTILDELVFALIVGVMLIIFGYKLNKKLETLKSQQALLIEESKLKFSRLLEFRERQLAEFYWPLVFRLEIDKVVWHEVLKIQDDSSQGRERASKIVEEYILPNDKAIQRILESKSHLSENEAQALELALRYVGNAAAYKAEQLGGLDSDRPVQRDQRLTHEFHKSLREAALRLQKKYDQELEDSGIEKRSASAGQ
jgi:hypothetical protein